jgi:hydroxymethylglutaryl-CoA lyase
MVDEQGPGGVRLRGWLFEPVRQRGKGIHSILEESMFEGRDRRVYVYEVAPRDGFQIEPTFIPTADKVALIDALSHTGLHKIEATSFTSPKAIPTLVDAGDVMREITRAAGVTYAAMVPNLRGAERALDARVDEVNVVMSMSETHNLANLRMTREQSCAQLTEVIQMVHEAGVAVNGSLSTCFGCPMEGAVSPDEVWRWAGRLLEAGADGISLCDTTGMAHPGQVAQLVQTFLRRWPTVTLTLHLHNTRGLGLANVLAALEAGANCFDASLGGLGGCPYAPGATGNVCTEDLVHMLEALGYRTGVDLDRLLKCARRLPGLVGHPVPGQVAKAGRIGDLHPAPDWLPEVSTRALERNCRSIRST